MARRGSPGALLLLTLALLVLGAAPAHATFKRGGRLQAPDGSTLEPLGSLALGAKEDSVITGEVKGLEDVGSRGWLALQRLRERAERGEGLSMAGLRQEARLRKDLDNDGE